jgi:hypothetical protein
MDFESISLTARTQCLWKNVMRTTSKCSGCANANVFVTSRNWYFLRWFIPAILLRVMRICSMHCQFARVAKGVDLRSTAGNCAWVRTPQLTFADTLCESWFPVWTMFSRASWTNVFHATIFITSHIGISTCIYVYIALKVKVGFASFLTVQYSGTLERNIFF